MSDGVAVLYGSVCGLDVHKEQVVACVRRVGPDGTIGKEVRTFGTMTRDLKIMLEWLKAYGVTHCAMESTGVFWKPIFNILEGHVELLLVNAQHIKHVPGRKTDVKDCEWIAQLLQCGLLRGSFVPPHVLRELRDLTRHRAKLSQQHTAVANRIHKVLQDANIKLSSVATDIFGKSGRDMIEAIIARNDDPQELAELARRRLRAKIPELQRALEGKVTDHHRFMLRTLLTQLDFLTAQIEEVSARIKVISPSPFETAVRSLCTIPGVEQRTAEAVVAEIGWDMKQFPTAAHLASWAGVCPGNNQSASKTKSGKASNGNRWLKRALGNASWAAARKKTSYFHAQFHRLAPRRGKNRAAVALQHSMLVVAHSLLARATTYQDLGADFFRKLNPDRHTQYYVKQLERLGHKVVLEPIAA